MKNYYQLLGVTEMASHSEIKIAYTDMYHKCLLDKDSGKNVDEKLIDLLVAYNALTNSKIKKEYNKLLYSTTPGECLINNDSYTHKVSYKGGRPQKHLTVIISAAIVIIVVVSISFMLYNNKHTINESNFVANKSSRLEEKIVSPSIIQAPKIDKISIKESAIPKTPRHINTGKEKHSKAESLKDKIPYVAFTEPKKSEPVITKSSIAQGSVKGEVLKLRGTPNAIVRFDSQNEIWCYANEKINFSNGIATSIIPE